MRLAPTRLFLAESGCLYPFREEVKPPPEPENHAMRRGKEIHVAIEHAVNGTAPPQASDETRTIADHAYRWQADRCEGARHAEHVIGLDPFTGVAQSYEDRLAVPQNHVPIIVDLAIVGPDVEVWDWKTGSPFSSFSYQPQAFANALGVGLLFGADKVTTGLAYVSREGVRPKSWTRDVFDFAEDKAKLRMWAEAAPTAEPVENASCRYCPVGKSGLCPAKKEAA